MTGEEWYGIGRRQVAVRPGKFLMMNNHQDYSSRIDTAAPVKSLSIFFTTEFASSVYQDLIDSEELLDHPLPYKIKNPKFFQTLEDIDPGLMLKLNKLISDIELHGYSRSIADEHLVLILRGLISSQLLGPDKTSSVNAVKRSTKMEIYKRLCIAKDFLESYYAEQPSLEAISGTSCMSVPQLIRQLKLVFNYTPHQYLMRTRLKRAAELLNHTRLPIHEITWKCGFENLSAFCRAFKSAYGCPPARFRE